jgi:A/G-specific adenine glycosylase
MADRKPRRKRRTAPPPTADAAMAVDLIRWFHAGKRDLPWRRTRDPYAIWVSEVMLQQTTVAAVRPYYERFLARFPTVQALAEAPEPDVLRHWAGLGYYSRCRNLHAAARQMIERFAGRVPDTVEDLLSLPGVGRYTAGAVASFAYGVRAPILDTNVARVLARLFCIDGDPREPAVSRRLWEIAGRLVPESDPGGFNAAIMELGATVCSPADPHCLLCPVRERCGAVAAGRPTAWPQLRPRRKPVQVHEVAVVVECGGRYLLARRRPGDLWAGMWEFPRYPVGPGETADAAALRVAADKLTVSAAAVVELPTVRHGVTFRRIRLDARLIRTDRPPARVEGYAEHRMLDLTEAAALPHSSPQARMLRNVAADGSAG